MIKKTWMFTVLLIGLYAAAGCDQKTSDTKPSTTAKADPKTKVKDGHEGHNHEGHDHSGWWCDDHGVIEEECSMCQTGVFKKLKPEEICTKHPDRAKSQCFICNPELWEKSKAVYKAKNGKEPPEPKDNMPGKTEKK